MLGQDIQPNDKSTASALDVMADMDNNRTTDVRTKRSHTRMSVKAKAQVFAANSSEREKAPVVGVCNDISAHGCRIMTMQPLRVGDMYWIKFDRQAVNLDPTFVRCVRSRFLREDAFESGFAFFTPVHLSAAASEDTDPADMI